MNLQTIASEDLQMRGNGNVNVTVKGVAEEGSAFLLYADDTSWEVLLWPLNRGTLAVRRLSKESVIEFDWTPGTTIRFPEHGFN